MSQFRPLSLLFFLLSLTSLIPQALSWGSLGHRTVAYLALSYLTPNASTYVSSLLNSQDISEASLWPDKVRHMPQFNHTAGWHYIDANDSPPTQCGVNLNRDCDVSDGCVVSAIANQTRRILDASSTHADKGQALRYLLHFFGDVHQPLHTEAEGRGGNDIDVLWRQRRTNLHAVWDSDIPAKRAAKEKGEDEKVVARDWANELFEVDRDHEGSLEGECHTLEKAVECSLDWADEVNQWICDYVLKDDVEGVEGKDLSTEYYEGAVPIVDLLIGKAGRRLGAWINALAVNASATDFDNSKSESLDKELVLPQEEL